MAKSTYIYGLNLKLFLLQTIKKKIYKKGFYVRMNVTENVIFPSSFNEDHTASKPIYNKNKTLSGSAWSLAPLSLFVLLSARHL